MLDLGHSILVLHHGVSFLQQSCSYTFRHNLMLNDEYCIERKHFQHSTQRIKCTPKAMMLAKYCDDQTACPLALSYLRNIIFRLLLVI
jgi:hypothetical protein